MNINLKHTEIYPYDNKSHNVIIIGRPIIANKVNRFLDNYYPNYKFNRLDEAKFLVPNNKLEQVCKIIGLKGKINV